MTSDCSNADAISAENAALIARIDAIHVMLDQYLIPRRDGRYVFDVIERIRMLAGEQVAGYNHDT